MPGSSALKAKEEALMGIEKKSSGFQVEQGLGRE